MIYAKTLGRRIQGIANPFLGIVLIFASNLAVAEETIVLRLQHQVPVQAGENSTRTLFHRIAREEKWKSNETAVIVCDMWDAHHCLNAVRRGAEIAPRIDRYISALRTQGATIIHAPSSCMEAYQSHPSRARSISTPRSKNLPDKIESWCDQIPSEEQAKYPIDQSAGGEDDEAEEHRQWAERLTAMGRNPRSPWKMQSQAIQIDGKLDFISDDGQEIWSILEHRGIQNVLLVGVHTNMCVLGRPFGLRRLATNGKRVALVRDLTDTMYDPKAWPYIDHFSGTDLIVDHIERYVCGTVTSDHILPGGAFRFQQDRRPRLGLLIGEDEYKTEQTLPYFADIHLRDQFAIETIHSSVEDKNQFPGSERLAAMDGLVISVRRRALPEATLRLVREMVQAGKPMIGIRTASHAFALKDQPPPPGHAVWPQFDEEVWGGNYQGHYRVEEASEIRLVESSKAHPLLKNWGSASLQGHGTLYRTAPLRPGTEPLFMGQLVGREDRHPVAWTHVRSDGGRSFYTSLGHEKDFETPEFTQLLKSGIAWAFHLTTPTLEQTKSQIDRYRAGTGRQRK